MEKIFPLVFNCLLLLRCSCEQGFLIGKKIVPSANHQEEQKQNQARFTLTRIAPTQETGEFAFVSYTALLENGKIIAVGYDGENIRNIRISTDKGQTWATRKFTDYYYTFPESIYFADDQHGWIGGGMGVFRTTDGGETWEMAEFKRDLSFTEPSFSGLQTGNLAGKHNIKGEIRGEIWKTDDGGKTWKRSYISRK